MISLLSLLSEIEIKNPNIIKLKDLEFDKDIQLPPISPGKNIPPADKQSFVFWKNTMEDYGYSNLILQKHLRSPKDYWWQTKFILTVPKLSNPENQKYWNS